MDGPSLERVDKEVKIELATTSGLGKHENLLFSNVNLSLS